MAYGTTRGNRRRPAQACFLAGLPAEPLELGIVEPIAPDQAREVAYQLRFDVRGDEIG